MSRQINRTIQHHLQQVDNVFETGSIMLKKLDHIEIPTLEIGELPPNNNVSCPTWIDLKLTACGTECILNVHNQEILKHDFQHTNVRIRCPSCAFRNSTKFAHFINHLIRNHTHKNLKFCCIICSKLFCNMPYLSNHYQEHHPNAVLRLFPCLKCGLYCSTIVQLKQHLKSCTLKPKKLDDLINSRQKSGSKSKDVQPAKTIIKMAKKQVPSLLTNSDASSGVSCTIKPLYTR